MSDATTHLLLPYTLAAQARKHVTHNEALRILDGLAQLSVLDRNLTAPPGSPTDRERCIVGSGAIGATLPDKINASAKASIRGRLVLNGTTEIRGSLGEISATHVLLATAIWLQTMGPLTAGDTVELQGYLRVADGYLAADHKSFWGCKSG